MNAKIGQGIVENVVGHYGLGVRNERGERIIEFCQQTDFTIMNTFFKLPPRRLYTWKSLADCNHRIVRNQIDFVMINRKYRNSVTSCKTYPGADIPTDHNLLLARIRLRLKKIVKKRPSKRLDVRKLQQEIILQRTKDTINNELRIISEESNPEIEVEQLWNKIRRSITSITERELRPDKTVKRKEWMTDNILRLMEERRQHRNKDNQKYKETHSQVLKAIKEAKERWLQERCIEIEMLQAKHDSFNLHKKIKAATGGYRGWRQYMEELFGNENSDDITAGTGNIGPTITQEEVEAAIKRLKNNKTSGPDQIHGEVLKLLDSEQVQLLTTLFNNIYTGGPIPNDWLLSHLYRFPRRQTRPNALITG
ncbi:uncharacterized protein LOC115875493 [Sitophilus oryzae]|uniref:Uncharacterized protein LOC115875493 n=1 Tax=Sitophilus oryzae TaxID=7048 RepID=A0A6J2X759_SITOR|nr:uncharacterized protein LOC115875493 [Sitophilus oryzae]